MHLLNSLAVSFIMLSNTIAQCHLSDVHSARKCVPLQSTFSIFFFYKKPMFLLKAVSECMPQQKILT